MSECYGEFKLSALGKKIMGLGLEEFFIKDLEVLGASKKLLSSHLARLVLEGLLKSGTGTKDPTPGSRSSLHSMTKFGRDYCEKHGIEIKYKEIA